MTLDEMEEAMIRKTLEFYAGNISMVMESSVSLVSSYLLYAPEVLI